MGQTERTIHHCDFPAHRNKRGTITVQSWGTMQPIQMRADQNKGTQAGGKVCRNKFTQTEETSERGIIARRTYMAGQLLLKRSPMMLVLAVYTTRGRS